MSEQQGMDDMMSKYLAQARKSKRENRMIFNHICVRVEDIDVAERLLSESFGIEGFLKPGGETFDEEKEFRVAWLDEHNIAADDSLVESILSTAKQGERTLTSDEILEIIRTKQ